MPFKFRQHSRSGFVRVPEKVWFSDALFGDYLDPRIILLDRFFESFVALPGYKKISCIVKR